MRMTIDQIPDNLTTGQRLVLGFVQAAKEGLAPIQCGAVLLHAIQKEKWLRAQRGDPMDASWQASVAWIACQIYGLPDHEAIIRACLVSMMRKVDAKTAACAEETRALELKIIALGNHRRDQILVRVMDISHADLLNDWPHRESVVMDAKLKTSWRHGSAHLFPPYKLSGWQKHRLQAILAMPPPLQNWIEWPNQARARDLLSVLKTRARDANNLRELVFFADSETRPQAMALASTIATLWNMPLLDHGDIDPVVLETAARAAVSTPRKPKIKPPDLVASSALG